MRPADGGAFILPSVGRLASVPLPRRQTCENTRQPAKFTAPAIWRQTDRRLAVLRSVDVRFARQTSANLLHALRLWKRWPTDCRTVAVSLQRVRSTSRADDRPVRLSAQLERRGTCRRPAVSEIELVPSGMLKLGASPSHYGLKNGLGPPQAQFSCVQAVMASRE
jgi:hypothetical protein